MIMEFISHDKDPSNSYTKEDSEKPQNLINMTNGYKKINIRPSICITEN